jgi:hypothetical protein
MKDYYLTDLDPIKDCYLYRRHYILSTDDEISIV